MADNQNTAAPRATEQLFYAFDHKGRSTVKSGHRVDAIGTGDEVNVVVAEGVGGEHLLWMSEVRWVELLESTYVVWFTFMALLVGGSMCVALDSLFMYVVAKEVDLGSLSSMLEAIRVCGHVYVVGNVGASKLFGPVWSSMGLMRVSALLAAGKRAVNDRKFRDVIRAPGTMEFVGIVMSFVFLVVGAGFSVSSQLWLWRTAFPALSALIMTASSFASGVRRALNRYGNSGIAMYALVQAFACVCGFPAMLFLHMLFYVVPFRFGSQLRGRSTVVQRHGTCSARMQELTRRMAVDMSRVDGILPTACLDYAGTGPQGQKESEILRRYAYLGDRVMALALASRASREKWTVESSSNVSQQVLTNAAFTKWFDVVVSDMFESFRGRSEKRKGTLVEALIGAAYESGCSLAEIEVFVFTQVVKAAGLSVTTTGLSRFIS